MKTASDGVKYIEKVKDELSKNHRLNDENEDGGVIMETGGESCPVRAIELYVSKLNPNIMEFFQRPKRATPISGPWYDAQVVGINRIAKYMKEISAAAELSKIYSNHCIRATTITVLDGKGYEARHIKTVSGHRSDNSLQSYCRTNLNTKRKMSAELSWARSYERETLPPKTFDFGLNFGQSPEKAGSSGSSSTSSSSSNTFNNCVFNIKY